MNSKKPTRDGIDENTLLIRSNEYKYKGKWSFTGRVPLNGEVLERLSVILYPTDVLTHTMKWRGFFLGIESAEHIYVSGPVTKDLLAQLNKIEKKEKTKTLTFEDMENLSWSFWEIFKDVVELNFVNTTSAYKIDDIKKPQNIRTFNIAEPENGMSYIPTAVQWFLKHENDNVDGQSFAYVVEKKTSLFNEEVFGNIEGRLSKVKKLTVSIAEEHLFSGLNENLSAKIGELKTHMEMLEVIKFVIFFTGPTSNTKSIENLLCGDDWNPSTTQDEVRYRVFITCVKK